MVVEDVFWFIATVTSGIAAGAMTGQLALLGRFLNWFFDSGNAEMFKASYPVFLEKRKAGLYFDNIFSLAIVAGISYFLFLVFTGGITVLPVIAIVLQWLFIAVFYGSGFAGIEGRLFRDKDTSRETVRKFLVMNIPVLAVLSLLWTGSFMLFICMKIR